MYRYVSLCIVSQCLFASLYLFSYFMQPLTGSSIFALRMVAMWVSLTVLLNFLLPSGTIVRFVCMDLGRDWQKWLVMLLGTLILGSQLWLFMWAPINQEGANVAMGYFLFPLMMVLSGRIWWKERLNIWQSLAIGLAIVGVLNELYHHRQLSWSTLWVALVYPPYYLSRKAIKIPALLGLFFDLCWIAPCCLFYLWLQRNELAVVILDNRYWLLIPLLGVVSTFAMFFNLLSNTHLPLKIFGMLSYLEPALLFLCAVFWLNTPIDLFSYVSYGCIWLGLIVLSIHGFLSSKQRKTN